MILKGYIFSRPFLEERVPQHVQNIVIQNYCKNRDYTFQLRLLNTDIKKLHLS